MVIRPVSFFAVQMGGQAGIRGIRMANMITGDRPQRNCIAGVDPDHTHFFARFYFLSHVDTELFDF